MMGSRRFWLGTGALAAAMAWSGFASAADPIKIGAALNLTGGLASIDEPAKNGAQLAVDKINAAGGVNGRPLQLVVYDGKTDPAVEASITTQLINSDKVPVILGFADSDAVLASAPLAQKAGIPFVTVGATSPKLPDQVGSNMFLACFGDNTQAAVAAAFAIDNLKLKNAYVIEDTGMEYTTLLSKYFQETFEKMGGKIVGRDTYRSGDKTFTAQITKVKAARTKPDFLFISAGPSEIGLIVRQVRQAGLTMPIVGGDGYDTPLLLEVGGNAANDVYFTTHALISPDSTGMSKQFYDEYSKAFGKPPESAFVALAYDTVYLIADAIKRAGSTTPSAIRDALQQTKNLPGVAGDIGYAEGSRVPVKGVSVIGVKGGKLTLAAQLTPTYVPKP
jgi:branched-chain amino acid transport system substrate-binding protein